MRTTFNRWWWRHIEELAHQQGSTGGVPNSRIAFIDGALANNTYEHYAQHLPDVKAWLRQRLLDSLTITTWR